MASTLEDAVVKIKQVVSRSGFSTEDTTTFNDNLDTYTTAEIVNLNIENRYNYKIQYEEEFNKTVSGDRFVYKCNGLSPKDFITSNNITSWRFGGENTTTYNTPSQEDVIDNYFKDSLYQRNEELAPTRQLPEDFFDNVLLFYSPSRTTQTFNLYKGTDTLRTLDATPNNNIYLKLGNSTQIQNIYIPIFGMNELSGITNLSHSLQQITLDSTYNLLWNTTQYTDENSYQFQGLTENAWGNTFSFFTEDSSTAKTGYILRIEDIQNWAWYLGLEKMAFTTEQAETWEYSQLPSLNPNVEPEPEPPYVPTPDDTPTTQGTPIIPGQPENKINNKGGTGTTIQDIIYNTPNNNFGGGAGWGNRQYALDYTQLQAIAKEIWNPDILQDLYTDPENTVISCVMFPFDISAKNTGTSANDGLLATQDVYLGKYHIILGTTTASTVNPVAYEINPVLSSMWDFGWFHLDRYFGSFIDYDPYTTIDIYLPYCGRHRLHAEKIQDSDIHLYYVVDYTVGSCKACIEIKRKETLSDGTVKENTTLEYVFDGVIGTQISFSSSNLNEVYAQLGKNAISAAIAGVGGFLGGSKQHNTINLDRGESAISRSSYEYGFSEGTDKKVIGSILNIPELSIKSVGSVGDSLGRMLPQEAYLIIERPITCMPSNFNSMYGRPSLVYRKLGDCKGFTSVSTMRNWTCSGTEYEKNLIEKIMSEGVVIK